MVKKGKQRYICKVCRRNFTPISNSLFIKSHYKYMSWLKFIHCELLGLSLEVEAHECNISKTTAFYWRHKLYSSLAETGRETKSKMKLLEPYIKNCTLFVCDGAHTVVTMAKSNNIPFEVIKANTYINENNYTLNEINEIHNELHNDLRNRKGVSVRHLQGYLDMFCLKKLLKYTTEYFDRDRNCLDKSIKSNVVTRIKDIVLKA